MKQFLCLVMALSFPFAWAQPQSVSSERAFFDSVSGSIVTLCQQFQVDLSDNEVQERIELMFGHLGLNRSVETCEDLPTVIGFYIESQGLQALSQMGAKGTEKIRAEYSLLISQLSKRQLGQDPGFTALSHLQLFEIVLLKGFYDGVKTYLQSQR